MDTILQGLLRRKRAWVWWAAALFAVGAAVIVVGALAESLLVVQIGLVFCLPMILVYYAALCLLIAGLAALSVNTIQAWLSGVREWSRRRRKGSVWFKPDSPKGVWDREIDG